MFTTLEIDVCLMELTHSKLTWNRSNQSLKVGSFMPNDTLAETKRKCAEAMNINSPPCDLDLIVKGAIVDDSAFPTLSTFMNSLSPQQRSHLCFGIGVNVCK